MLSISRLVTAICILGALLALAACGSDNEKPATPPPSAPAPSAGTVGAEGTAGLIGPSIDVEEDGKQKVTSEGGKMAPDLDRPTDAQKNGVAGAGACATAAANPAPSNLNSIASATICLLNAERSGKGLPPLHLNGDLNRASKLMAGLMVKQRFFAHDTPDGRSVVDRVKPTGYIRGSWSLGENLAWGSGALATPRAIVNGWMNSKGHRENILRSKFKDIGIGVKLGAPGQGLSGGATYVTDFGRHG